MAHNFKYAGPYGFGPFFFGRNTDGKWWLSICPGQTVFWLHRNSCYIRINGKARFLWGG